jgi:hypothetical protein
MRVFVAGGTGHSDSRIIPELIAARARGHRPGPVGQGRGGGVGARREGAPRRPRRSRRSRRAHGGGRGLRRLIHVVHRQDLLPFGGMDAVSAAELPVMLAYGEALAGTGKPLVAAGSIGSSGSWAARPPRRTRPSPSAMSTRAPSGSAMWWKPQSSTLRSAVFGRADRQHHAQHDRCRPADSGTRLRTGASCSAGSPRPSAAAWACPP